MELCSVCEALLNTVFDAWPAHSEQRFDHRLSADEVSRSAPKCFVCAGLEDKVRQRKQTTPDDGRFKHGLLTTHCDAKARDDTQEVHVYFMYQEDPDIDAMHMHQIDLYEATTVEPFLSDFARGMQGAARSPLQQAKSWLSTCIADHELCNMTIDGHRRLPGRLIRVAKEHDGDGSLVARLRNTDSIPLETPYLTLSHCWGNSHVFRLIQANLFQLEQSIPIHQLSKVFVDAMEITLQLGFEYLWIDSLCIVQDTPDGGEWNKECCIMDSIYGNAVCNLAATGFVDGSLGLPFNNNCQLPQLWATFCHRQQHTGQPTQCRTWCVIEDMKYATTTMGTEGPLQSRGWVLQETLMARRILHFTQDQIAWQCAESWASELFPKGWLYDQMFNEKSYFHLPSLSPRQSMRDEQKQGYREWRTLVNQYSSLRLTFPEDKLPALSGLAKIYSSIFNDVYLAGLWKGDLHTQLLWWGRNGAVSSTEYRAPSWSWASVDGDCLMGQFGRWTADWVPCTDVLETDISLESQDLYGRVTGGFLRLRGMLKDCGQGNSLHTYGAVEAHDDSNDILRPANSVNIRLQPSYTQALHEKHLILLPLQYSASLYDSDDSDAGDSDDSDADDSDDSNADDSDDSNADDSDDSNADDSDDSGTAENGEDSYVTVGIILTPTGKRGEFKNVGAFLIDGQERFRRMFEEQEPLPEELYEEFDGHDRYTIRVV